MPHHVYLAGPGFNEMELAHMAKLEERIAAQPGYEVFNPFKFSSTIFHGRPPAQCSREERQQVLNENIRRLQWATAVVAWLNRPSGGYDGRPDTGVVWELGYTYLQAEEGGFAAGPVTIGYINPGLGLPPSGLNLMLSETLDAITYDIDELMAALNLSESLENLEDVRERFQPDVSEL